MVTLFAPIADTIVLFAKMESSVARLYNGTENGGSQNQGGNGKYDDNEGNGSDGLNMGR